MLADRSTDVNQVSGAGGAVQRANHVTPGQVLGYRQEITSTNATLIPGVLLRVYEGAAAPRQARAYPSPRGGMCKSAFFFFVFFLRPLAAHTSPHHTPASPPAVLLVARDRLRSLQREE